ncbi:MAG: hypothetical protein M0P13_05250 [Fibrobacteraceae bacterium]|nr:hypothetical protein [Fibrobacteraceae bacterium]
MRYLVCILFSVAVIAFAFHYTKPLPNLNTKEEFLPKANYVRYIAAGNEVTVSGLFWIRGLIDLGESYLSGNEFTYLAHVGNLSTELDSLFYTPYSVVGCVTSTNASDTADFTVMRRALRVYPDDWRLAIYFALRLANGPTHNNAEAAEVMKPFSTSSDTTIPLHIKTIYRTFELGSMQTELAIQTILEDCLNPQYRSLGGSFYPKTMRVLHRTYADPESEEIRIIIEKVMNRKMNPNYAYKRLLELKSDKEIGDIIKLSR